jgi:hypothetical protein
MHAPDEISREKCAATATIKSRFGRTAAFDCLVGEKLLARIRDEALEEDLPSSGADLKALRQVADLKHLRRA